MELVTKRLRIRDFRAEDAHAAFLYLSDPMVMRYLEPPFSLPQTQAFIQSCGVERSLVFALEDRAQKALLGHVIFHPDEAGDWEIGWVLGRQAWGRGYGRESGGAMLGHAFGALDAPGVVAETLPEHRACQRLLRSLGLAATGYRDGLAIFRLGKEAWNPCMQACKDC